jgi:hypothetical protein
MSDQWYPIEQKTSVQRIENELRFSGWYNVVVSLAAIVLLGLFLFKDYIFFNDWTFPIELSSVLFGIVCVLNVFGVLYGSFKIRTSRRLVNGLGQERIQLLLRVMDAFALFDMPWFTYITDEIRKIYTMGGRDI